MDETEKEIRALIDPYQKLKSYDSAKRIDFDQNYLKIVGKPAYSRVRDELQKRFGDRIGTDRIT